MQAILEIRSGPLTGERIQLELGKSVRFGRRNIADFVLPDDTHMSSLHFMVEYDEKGAVLPRITGDTTSSAPERHRSTQLTRRCV